MFPAVRGIPHRQALTCSDVMVDAFDGDDSVRDAFSVGIRHQAFDAAVHLLGKHDKTR